MMQLNGMDFKGKNVVISGSGNVAQYAAEKALHLGAVLMRRSWPMLWI